MESHACQSDLIYWWMYVRLRENCSTPYVIGMNVWFDETNIMTCLYSWIIDIGAQLHIYVRFKLDDIFPYNFIPQAAKYKWQDIEHVKFEIPVW